MIDLGLCVALMAATSWAVQAAGWVDGGGAVVVGLAAVLEAALLARARAPRVVVVLVAPILALVTIVPATLAGMPAAPHQSFATIASRYLRALFTGLGSAHGWEFTVGLCAILFLCGYWLGWMALHEHRGVLAVVPAYSLLAVAVLNVTNPAELALPVTLAMALSLAVIAAAHLGSLDARWGLEGSSRLRVLDGGSLAGRPPSLQESPSLRWCFLRSAAPISRRGSFRRAVIPALVRTEPALERMASHRSDSTSP